MGRKKSSKVGYVSTTSECGYKSIKIYDSYIITNFNKICRRENVNWGRKVSEVLLEYIENHKNDDLNEMSLEELRAECIKLRNGLK